MLEASITWYQDLKRKPEGHAFEFNNYNACVCNKIVDNKQHTMRFHVDNIFSRHVDPKVNDEFQQWLDITFGDLKK